jgi:Icc-related predicted phosphoesterase
VQVNGRSAAPVRVAAAGDIHCGEHNRAEIRAAFAGLVGRADLVLLAGDLTTQGEPDQARVLADACRGLPVPVVAVLGNHDWHANRTDEVARILAHADVLLLERESTVLDVRGIDVGIVGLKGFVGGFPDASLPDFGEPLLRQVYAETTGDVDALERGLQEIGGCGLRIVLLHYSPTITTVEGEARGIWPFLGSDRLGQPIAEYTPDLVLHGHAHAGTFEGFIGAVPVYNVAVQVTQRDFWIFELGAGRPHAELERVAEPRAE